jgi:hypothetical protein
MFDTLSKHLPTDTVKRRQDRQPVAGSPVA